MPASTCSWRRIDWKALYDNTLAEARSGEIPAARLNDAVRRILRVKFRLGLFETARPYEGRMELLNSPASRALAREAVRRSLVLLKNGGVLPIRALGSRARDRAGRRQHSDAMRRLVRDLAGQRHEQRGLSRRASR